MPILHDGATTVWDSLAICEYAAERWPSIRGWPTDVAQRYVDAMLALPSMQQWIADALEESDVLTRFER